MDGFGGGCVVVGGCVEWLEFVKDVVGCMMNVCVECVLLPSLFIGGRIWRQVGRRRIYRGDLGGASLRRLNV